MAHAQSNSKSNKLNGNGNAGGDGEVQQATFHDFLSNKGKRRESVTLGGVGSRPPPEFLPTASSDQGHERYSGNHLEGIPFYGSRGDLKGPETSNRFSGNKRSNSDSFMVASRDKFALRQGDSQDTPVMTKLMRCSGGQQPTQPHDEETSIGFHQMRPIPASFVLQSSVGDRNEANSSKLNGAIPVNIGPVLQHPSRAGQVIPVGYQTPSNRSKDTNIGPVVSQIAADEGSRTGIKGSGVLSSFNATGAIYGRQPSGVLIRSGKQKSGACISEPDSSTTSSQRGMDSGGRQMTIFYDGQAHVFDNINPSKADVIMALAGSNGGSWSTISTPNSSARTATGENCIPGGENDVGMAILREFHERPSDKVDSYRDLGSSDK